MGYLDKLIVAKGFKNLPKVAQSGHTEGYKTCGYLYAACLISELSAYFCFLVFLNDIGTRFSSHNFLRQCLEESSSHPAKTFVKNIFDEKWKKWQK